MIDMRISLQQTGLGRERLSPGLRSAYGRNRRGKKTLLSAGQMHKIALE
jgi:hypothetical protein